MTMSPALAPLSWLYAGGVALRNSAYDRGLLRTFRCATPVLCVGNITVGGTGKTPMVHYLVGRCGAYGIRAAVLSRGYGRSSSGAVVVSDGRALTADPRRSGDEPLEIALREPFVPVVVDEDRVRGARMLEADFRPGIILLDDGFQHRRLARDADIVIVDAADLAGGVRMLPWGRFREPLSALRRAACVVLRGDGTFLERTRALVARASDAPVVLMKIVPGELRAYGGGPRTAPPGSVVGFCGIAKPERFRSSLEQTGCGVAALKSFPDHHWYSDADIAAIAGLAEKHGSAAVVTTEKDAARLTGMRLTSRFTERLLVLTVRAEIAEGSEQLDGILRATATRSRQ